MRARVALGCALAVVCAPAAGCGNLRFGLEGPGLVTGPPGAQGGLSLGGGTAERDYDEPTRGVGVSTRAVFASSDGELAYTQVTGAEYTRLPAEWSGLGLSVGPIMALRVRDGEATTAIGASLAIPYYIMIDADASVALGLLARYEHIVTAELSADQPRDLLTLTFTVELVAEVRHMTGDWCTLLIFCH